MLVVKEIGALTSQPSYAVEWSRMQSELLGSTHIKTNHFEASPTTLVRAEVDTNRFSLMIDLIEKLEEQLAELKQIVRLKDSATTSVNGPDFNALNSLITHVNRTSSILKLIQKDISEHYGKHGKSLWQAGVYVYLHSMDHLLDLVEKVEGLVSGGARQTYHEGYQGELGVLLCQLQQVKSGFKSFMKSQADWFLHTRDTIKNLEMTLAAGASTAGAANDFPVRGTTDVQRRLAAGSSSAVGAGASAGAGADGVSAAAAGASAGAGAAGASVVYTEYVL